jgi:Na+/proline symporter
MADASGGFGWLDWSVLAVYFAGITLFGLWISRKIRTSGGYFLGERSLPWWIMIGQSFGTGTNAENPVAQAGATFANGFATIWYQWKNMLITPFYWLLAPWYRRSRRTTVAEIVEDRYGRPLGLVYAALAIAYFVFNQGAMLKGAGKVISVATGGDMISPNGVVYAMTVTFILYSFFGGLIASAYTDFVQGFLIIALSFMLIPFGLSAVGGFSGMRAQLPADFFDLYNATSGIDGFAVAMLALNGLVGITAQPHMLSMYATGRSERGGRIGMTYGSMVKRFCTIGWALTGLIVAAFVIQEGITLHEPEAAFGYACLHFLGPGLVGLMVACVLAANMSTCSNFMVNTGALFTRNIYCACLRPAADDREILAVGRISGLALTLLGVWFALGVEHILSAFMFTETLPALLGIMFMGGFLWKRANRHGAAASIVVAFAVYYFLNFLMTCKMPDGPSDLLWPVFRQAVCCRQEGRLGEFLGSGQLLLFSTWRGGPFGCAMLAGFVALVVVSLITRPEPPENIRRFFEKMECRGDGPESADAASLAPAAACGEDLLLLDLPGWFTAARWRGFFTRYREDLVGFALAWGTVGALVLSAWLLMQIGK